jgi:hypothetical protein
MLAAARTVVAQARTARAERAVLVASARVTRRQGRKLRDAAVLERDRTLELAWTAWSFGVSREVPAHVPLSWEPQLDAAEALARAADAAGECATACAAASTDAAEQDRAPLQIVAGAASVGERYASADDPDAREALLVCARLVEVNLPALDLVAGPAGVVAASAARRCLKSCRRVLPLLAVGP